jgi:hypothetical protein
MRLVECLYDGEVGLCGVVDVDAACTGGGEQLCARRCHGENVAGFRMRIVDSVEGEVLFRL